MIPLIISNVSALALVGYLGYLLRESIRSAREREDQLLRWVKDTPTAVTMTSNGNGTVKLNEPSYVDNETEATYEDEEAPASND